MMNSAFNLFLDLAVISILITGIRQFGTPRGAWLGNVTAAFALASAMGITLLRHGASHPQVVVVALFIGSLAGWLVARQVNMIQIPAMVAFQHGAGGIAAFLVAFVELTRIVSTATPVGKISGVIGLTVGAATFSGSMVASAKLASKIGQTPTIFPKHNLILLTLLAGIFMLGAIVYSAEGVALFYTSVSLIIISIALGLAFSIRIGGADMPVLISFLNATAGLAASFCGILIQNKLLIACGATVAASGSILTHAMCKAMNRGLHHVFIGPKATAKPASLDPILQSPTQLGDDHRATPLAVDAIKTSKKIIVIPGYGMALAQAQFKVVELVRRFEQMGKEVKFAIHPVAGRMPGHMNVLLAEADVSYDQLCEMEEINPEFKKTDLALIIGACDVVNPAAVETEGTPISGMPILMAHEAKHVIVCNFDGRPGYSGVENPLYRDGKTILLFGDAKETLKDLETGLRGRN